jgi:hypothetical protein
MELETTLTATEIRAFAVPFVGMPTVRTLLRSVTSIYQENVLSKRLGFIADKLLKLVERPVIELAVELFTSALLDSDFAQIFKSKYIVFRVNNLLRYAVIGVGHKPSFLTRQTLKFAFGRFGAFGLQLLAKMGIMSTPIFDLLRVVKRVIRADCDIYYPAIYSKNFEVFVLIRIAMIKRYMQIENLVSAIIRDCGGLDSPFKVITVMRRNEEGCLDSPVGAGNCRQAVDQVDCYDSLIVPHSREWLSFWERPTFNGFKSFTGTISSSLHKRRRKIGDALTSKLVGCIVVIDLIPRLILESPFCGYRERFGVSSHRIQEGPAILVDQPKLEGYRPKHTIYIDDYIIYTFRRCKHALLPTLKDGGSALLLR